MNHSGLHYRVCGNEVRADMAFVASDLTFLHTSFAILFCQKKVKKIRRLSFHKIYRHEALKEVRDVYTGFEKMIYRLDKRRFVVTRRTAPSRFMPSLLVWKFCANTWYFVNKKTVADGFPLAQF